MVKSVEIAQKLDPSVPNNDNDYWFENEEEHPARRPSYNGFAHGIFGANTDDIGNEPSWTGGLGGQGT